MKGLPGLGTAWLSVGSIPRLTSVSGEQLSNWGKETWLRCTKEGQPDESWVTEVWCAVSASGCCRPSAERWRRQELITREGRLQCSSHIWFTYCCLVISEVVLRIQAGRVDVLVSCLPPVACCIMRSEYWNLGRISCGGQPRKCLPKTRAVFHFPNYSQETSFHLIQASNNAISPSEKKMARTWMACYEESCLWRPSR